MMLNWQALFMMRLGSVNAARVINWSFARIDHQGFLHIDDI